MAQRTWLIFTLCLVTTFGLASRLDLWFAGWKGNRSESVNLMDVALGDARVMFANHFFLKADAYFHSGYYPSIFDGAAKEKEAKALAMAGETGYGEHQDIADLHHPHDWIEDFGRNFFPSEHVHLDQGGAEHHHHEGEAHEHDEPADASGVREILPWLRLSASLDPHRVQTYTLTAFWLRKTLNAPEEAEAFLREGLSANPDSYEIMFELGRLYEANHNDTVRARNLWQLALEHWLESEPQKEEPDGFMMMQISSHLALLEEREGNLQDALHYMQYWKKAAPHPEQIQKRIDAVQARMDEEEAAQEPKP